MSPLYMFSTLSFSALEQCWQIRGNRGLLHMCSSGSVGVRAPGSDPEQGVGDEMMTKGSGRSPGTPGLLLVRRSARGGAGPG
jgi:hypothetical protein